jgi:UDP-N-acetylmuramoyl-L-alanyl-D-glutamate--2,6-diaminopimelate ligase
MRFGEAFEYIKDLVYGGLPVHSDSRRVQGSDVFVALPGVKSDGADYIADALNRGAGVIVTENPEAVPADCKAEVIVVDDAGEALGELAAAYYKTDEHDLTLVGVTGTNGKTTVTHMIEHIMNNDGHGTGMIGTLAYRFPGFYLDAPLTTPDCLQLHELMANMSDAEVDTVIMEVSSHALMQNRTAGLKYHAAVLTNLTQDHLDYHGTMENYFEAKAKLFTDVPLEDKVGIINFDDAYGRLLLARHERHIGYGLSYPDVSEGKSLVGEILELSGKGIHLKMRMGEREWELRSPLVGRFNASNLLAAQACAISMGKGVAALKSLEHFHGVPGRLERIPDEKGRHIFVDYAHTPDALVKALGALRELDFKRLLVVFGCGGDRDREKRPLMGEAACAGADLVILTSDNPRFEDPLHIMRDVKPGLTTCAQLMEEADRKEAIRMAVAEMKKGDALLVAGKGHETYQEIKGERFPFSDAETLRECLA